MKDQPLVVPAVHQTGKVLVRARRQTDKQNKLHKNNLLSLSFSSLLFLLSFLFVLWEQSDSDVSTARVHHAHLFCFAHNLRLLQQCRPLVDHVTNTPTALLLTKTKTH
jgi:hypothetical protein